MITPKDLLNSKRQSGYNHVNYHGPRDDRHAVRYRASRGTKQAGSPGWYGPTRKTPLEAAQDYCDYVNQNPLVGLRLSITNNVLKSAGHTGKRSKLRRDPELEAAFGVIRDRKGEQEGKQGYVYCIAEALPDGSVSVGGHWQPPTYVKIGFSTNPEARVAELQTGNPRKLKLLGKIPGTVEDEAAMHQKYIHHNVLQEWFQLTPMILFEFVKTVPSDGEAKVAA